MSEKIKKILSISANVLVVIIIILAGIVSFLFFNASKDEEIPSAFGYSSFAIQTDSMEDEIKKGDFIIGKKCEASELEVDDIITFYTVDNDGNIFINTHRIVEKHESGFGLSFTTKGDNIPQNDERKVAEGDIISKYTGFRLPLLGYVLTFLSTQTGFFVCIVLPILLYTIWQVYKLIVVVMHNQKVKLLKEVNDQTSDAVKEAVIAEYLAKQKEEEEKKKGDIE